MFKNNKLHLFFAAAWFAVGANVAAYAQAASTGSGHAYATWHGVVAPAGTPQAFAAYIQVEIPKWTKVIRDSGARAE